ncbi:hypothetical protein AC1031_002671 [Aphanomyces cochlioides]|nr:hypothetical protein AC1031_002671 [Aphanomyces cochlioides]
MNESSLSLPVSLLFSSVPMEAANLPMDAVTDSNNGNGDDSSPVRSKSKEEPPLFWCNASVGKLFELRYKSPLASLFDSKNNNQKKLAYASLAAELSIAMDRTFTSKQIQDKFARMKSEWSTSKPSTPMPTGNGKLAKQPCNMDIMLEYWSEKRGMQRESLLSTDDEQTTKPSTRDDAKKTTKRSTFEKHDNGRTAKKQKSPAEALESGLNAIKDG